MTFVVKGIAVFVIALVLLSASCAKGALFLAKTTETFKLADLQYLEAKIQCSGLCISRLLMDAATGSSLFELDSLPDEEQWPTSLSRRCQWVGRVLVKSQETAEEFLKEIREAQDQVVSAGWTLDYLRLQTKANRNVKTSYTSKTLLTCVAQSISAPAQLTAYSNASSCKLVIVDTLDHLFLIRIIQNDNEDTQEERESFKWSRRPFQYSSAINQNVAEIVVNILDSLIDKRTPVLLMDPTCGSGTFLATALSRNFNMSVQGYDVNPNCVQGTIANLEYIMTCCGDESKQQQWRVVQGDATRLSEHRDVDCVVANLPWGQNTIDYADENSRILERLSAVGVLKSRTPCAFITKSADLQVEMKRLGYKLLGYAYIPQQDFELPGRKQGDASKDSTSRCVVTIALSPGDEMEVVLVSNS